MRTEALARDAFSRLRAWAIRQGNLSLQECRDAEPRRDFAKWARVYRDWMLDRAAEHRGNRIEELVVALGLAGVPTSGNPDRDHESRLRIAQDLNGRRFTGNDIVELCRQLITNYADRKMPIFKLPMLVGRLIQGGALERCRAAEPHFEVTASEQDMAERVEALLLRGVGQMKLDQPKRETWVWRRLKAEVDGLRQQDRSLRQARRTG